MTDYSAPLDDIQFVLTHIAALDELAQLPGYEECTQDTTDIILQEAARFASTVLAPLNHSGDTQGSHLDQQQVITPDGWKDAYQQFFENGWNSLAFDPQYGGQGLPWTLATAVFEMWHSANMAFGLCPLLTQGAIEAIQLHGSDALKAHYLPKMIAGEWTGTMNLTEPQAGSDLSTIKTKAIPKDDHYLIKGQKIFITYGDHDLTENIIHLVLARTPDAPQGVKGISLFVVPKFLADANGNSDKRNDLRCLSLEHKLGIHASPTAVLSFGENEGAIGYLVGEENKGLQYMFTMMNLSRHGIGIESLGICERAYQQARDYAKQRIQGVGSDKKPAAIIEHPDVRRMLLTVKSNIEAMRALIYLWSSYLDIAKKHSDPSKQAKHQARVDLLTPIAKGWCTELSTELTSICLQVHGGMGYIEETGAAQHFRDARITSIYEGTTGIQANDLVGRKVLRDNGAAIYDLLDEIDSSAKLLHKSDTQELIDIGLSLSTASTYARNASSHLLTLNDSRQQQYIAVPYLKLFGTLCGGWLLGKSALIAEQQRQNNTGDARFMQNKIATAFFYSEQILPNTSSLAETIINSSPSALELAINYF